MCIIFVVIKEEIPPKLINSKRLKDFYRIKFNLILFTKIYIYIIKIDKSYNIDIYFWFYLFSFRAVVVVIVR